MSSYKKQHFLPVVYLRQFSPEGIESSRRTAKVWRYSPKVSACVLAANECCSDFHYSKANARNTEEMFGELENFYGESVKKIWNCEPSTRKDYFTLILMMFDLHCRSAVYKNLTDKENINAYYIRIQALRDQLLMGDVSQGGSDHKLWSHLKKFWRVRLFRAERLLITSDNPVLWFTLDTSNDLHLMMMPVNPHVYAVAWDSRYSIVSGGTLTEQDEKALNLEQVRHCIECIYTSVELPSNEKEIAQHIWQTSERPFGYVDVSKWDFPLLKISSNQLFSFLKVLPQK